jgi:homocysteine S-methyltransferase
VEAVVLVELLNRVQLPSWISFSCRDGEQINDGTPIEEVADLFRYHPQVLAVGINCTRPQFAVSLIERIRSVLPGKAIVVYPNSGETFDAGNKTWSGTVSANDWATAARSWIAAGATVVGGCCRTGPEHIRAIARSGS